ncbi:MAG: GntR family transcriptional regulator, partial [Mesorhizobium sp.]
VEALTTQDAHAAREALAADISRPFTFLRNKLQSAAAKAQT